MRAPRSAGTPLARLSALHVLNDGLLASLPLLLPLAKEELALGLPEIGALGGILSAAGVALAFPSAWIAGRLGGARALRWALGACGAGFLLFGLSRGFAGAAAAFALASLGFGIFHPIAFSLVAAGADGEGGETGVNAKGGEGGKGRRASVGKRMGDFTAVGDFGRLGFAASVTLAASLLTWRGAAFLYASVPLAVFAAATLLSRRAGRGAGAGAGGAGGADAEARESAAKRRPRAALKPNRALVLTLAAIALDGMAGSSLFMFLPFLLVERGIPAALLGSLTGAFFLGNLFGKTLLGRLSDRAGNRAVFAAAELLMAALLVLVARAGSTPAIVGLSVLLGAMTKGTVPVLNTMLADAVKESGAYELAYGAGSFASGVAASLSPLLFGLVAGSLGIESVFLASAGFALAAILPALFAAKRRSSSAR
ncbi:MAG: MFS transporter [Spirochaetaceae bacterium]|nr:MFS transporter [Spirochaetaceae bacterium]